MKYLDGEGNVIIAVQQSTRSSTRLPAVWHAADDFDGVFTGSGYQTLFKWLLKSGKIRDYFYLKPTDNSTASMLATQCNSPNDSNGGHPGLFYNAGIRGSEVKILTEG